MIKGEDFNQIKQELVNEIKGMRKDMDIFMKTLNVHDIALYGDRTNKEDGVGVMEQVRTLVASKKNQDKHMGWIWTAIIASVVERFFHYFWPHK